LIYLRLHHRFAWVSGKCGSLVASAFGPVQPRVSFPTTGADDSRWLRFNGRLWFIRAVATTATCQDSHLQPQPLRTITNTSLALFVRSGLRPHR
jgi:hypothetical protein